METEAEEYWPQEKLFFIASCALFPKNIISSPIISNQTSIDLFGYDEQLKTLEEYQSAGMLEVVDGQDSSGNKQYILSNINQSKFYTKMVDYLQQFRNDELLANSIDRPEQYGALQDKLCQYLTNSNRNKPIVKPFNIWSDWSNLFQGYGRIRPFWEIILSSSELSPKMTRTHNIGYSTADNGSLVPFAEVERSDPKLLKSPLAKLNDANLFDTHRARIIIEDRIIYATIGDSNKFRISRRLRTDMRPHLFIKFILSHPRTNIPRADLKTAVNSTDITELIRRCGFDRSLKEIFFPDTTEQVVYFQPDVNVNDAQTKLLAEHRWDLVGKQNPPNL